jgi:HD superfamily phosphodiesterase
MNVPSSDSTRIPPLANLSLENRDTITNILLRDKEMEFRCHVQFVRDIGLQLANRYQADPVVVEISCLLHDIGRDEELPGEKHEQASVRLTRDILQYIDISEERKKQILLCIGNHNAERQLDTLEERILISADAASKVLYYEAFMLMCKKTTYLERLMWGMKYLEKGYRKIQIEEFRREVEPRYNEIKGMCTKILG